MPTIKEFNNYKNSAKNDIRASIKLRPFLPLIEQTVRKYGWELLEPFVESVVRELIYKKFNVQAKKMLPYWVTLATSMEANLPLKDITCIFPDKDSGKFIANNYMFGGTPIQEAVSISSIRFNSSRYIDHQKLLIIICDGEFTSSNIDQNLQTPIAISTGLLKKTGVTILSLAICNKNILQKLQSHLPSDTPTGVQVLFDLASPCEENDFLFQCGLKTDNGKKWCFQVNHANHIETIMGKILGNYE